MKAAEERNLLALAEYMMDEVAYVDVLVEKLPNFKARSVKWDATIAKFYPRRRGDRSKLNGAVLVEEVAVDLVKWRRRQLRREGLAWDEAWEQALGEVALKFNVSASTLEDWYKGKSRRVRKKRGGGF